MAAQVVTEEQELRPLTAPKWRAAQVVTEEQELRPLTAPEGRQVELAPWAGQVGPVGLGEVVLEADPLETLHGRRHVRSLTESDEDVDAFPCPQSRDRRAADVLDPDREARESVGNLPPRVLELFRPGWVIRMDSDGRQPRPVIRVPARAWVHRHGDSQSTT